MTHAINVSLYHNIAKRTVFVQPLAYSFRLFRSEKYGVRKILKSAIKVLPELIFYYFVNS